MVRFERVFGEILDEVKVDAQEIPHGVLVLEIGEPARRGDRGFLACFFDVGEQAVVDPVGDCLTFRFARLRLVLRRHLAKLQRIEHILPSLEPPPRRQVAIQCVQCHLALALIRTVTLATVRFEKRPHASIVSIRARRDRRSPKSDQRTLQEQLEDYDGQTPPRHSLSSISYCHAHGFAEWLEHQKKTTH